jgi:ankyrin repeat protein
MLTECGADLSAQDKHGKTLLHLASQEGHVEVSRMLIERGADVSAQDKVGKTPLHITSTYSYLAACAMACWGACTYAGELSGVLIGFGVIVVLCGSGDCGSLFSNDKLVNGHTPQQSGDAPHYLPSRGWG